MLDNQILRCPHCGVGQGEIGSKITYRRKRGAIHFDPTCPICKHDGEFQLDCHYCGKSSIFKRSPNGDLLLIK
jgi:hypothetical protein